MHANDSGDTLPFKKWITNTFAAIPGLVGGILTGVILDVTNSWDMVFYVTAGVTFFGGLFYLLFASTEKQFD